MGDLEALGWLVRSCAGMTGLRSEIIAQPREGDGSDTLGERETLIAGVDDHGLVQVK